MWTAEVERSLREQREQPSAPAKVRKQLGVVEAKIGRLVDALGSGLMGSSAVTTALREAEAERNALTARLSASTDTAPIDLRATVGKAASEFARMVEELPRHLSDRDTVYKARETLREWLGEFRIEPTDDGPTAFWRLNDKGLLFTAGPCVAKMVAGAGFEPATFGL